jgi:hypothetical protein
MCHFSKAAKAGRVALTEVKSSFNTIIHLEKIYLQSAFQTYHVNQACIFHPSRACYNTHPSCLLSFDFPDKSVLFTNCQDACYKILSRLKLLCPLLDQMFSSAPNSQMPSTYMLPLSKITSFTSIQKTSL